MRKQFRRKNNSLMVKSIAYSYWVEVAIDDSFKLESLQTLNASLLKQLGKRVLAHTENVEHLTMYAYGRVSEEKTGKT
jgi:hypothetical protein